MMPSQELQRFIGQGGLDAASWHYANRGGERGVQRWAGGCEVCQDREDSMYLGWAAIAGIKAAQRLTANMRDGGQRPLDIPTVQGTRRGPGGEDMIHVKGHVMLFDPTGEVLQHLDMSTSIPGDILFENIGSYVLEELLNQAITKLQEYATGKHKGTLGSIIDNIDDLVKLLNVNITMVYR